MLTVHVPRLSSISRTARCNFCWLCSVYDNPLGDWTEGRLTAWRQAFVTVVYLTYFKITIDSFTRFNPARCCWQITNCSLSSVRFLWLTLCKTSWQVVRCTCDSSSINTKFSNKICRECKTNTTTMTTCHKKTPVLVPVVRPYVYSVCSVSWHFFWKA